MNAIEKQDLVEAPRRAGGPPHVLVVEDDRPLLDALCSFVGREGYSVEGAEDGEQALKAISRRRPDIVILDLVLPRMDGYQVMESLVQRHGRGRPKVLVLSASERLDLARVRLGADAYIAKPFDVDRLRAALKRLAIPALRAAAR